MKILVAGGRDYKNEALVNKVLDNLDPKPTCVIQGGALGADRLGFWWAVKNNIPQKTYLAKWDLHKKAAGPIRNALMLSENPDIELAVLFLGGRGTEDMRQKLTKKGIKILEITE
jgi:hypothetical protein